MFSDKYLTTVGVKIDKKTVAIDGNEVMLMIWDLAGDDDYQRLQTSYLRGTSGYFLPMAPARLPWTRQSKFRVG
jgi:GTPase SAR1 family protein